MFLVKWGREERKRCRRVKIMLESHGGVEPPRGGIWAQVPPAGSPQKCFSNAPLCSSQAISISFSWGSHSFPDVAMGYGPGRGRPTPSLPTEEADLGWRDSTHLVHTWSTWNFHSPYPTLPEACANQNTYSVAKGSYEIISLKRMTEYMETMGVKLTNMSSLPLFVFTFKK